MTGPDADGACANEDYGDEVGERERAGQAPTPRRRKRPAIGGNTAPQKARAGKIYDDFLRRLQRAAEERDDRAYRATCSNFAGSHAAKFTALIRANKTLPRQARRTDQELFELAKGINLFRRCAEPAIIKLIPKDPDKPDKGFREIIRFGPINKARQIIVNDMNDHLARTIIQLNQYHLNGGRNKAIDEILDKVRSGYRWAVVFDVTNFYQSINLDQVAAQLPIPTGILRNVCAAEAYDYQEHEDNSRLRRWAINEFQQERAIITHILRNIGGSTAKQWASWTPGRRQRVLDRIIGDDTRVGGRRRQPRGQNGESGTGRSGLDWYRHRPDGTARMITAADIRSIDIDRLQTLDEEINILQGRRIDPMELRDDILYPINSIPETATGSDRPSRSGIPQGAKTSARLGEIALASVIGALPKAISFVDDGVIPAKTRTEAYADAETLRRLIGQCRNGHFCLKPERFMVVSFARQGVAFLGYDIRSRYGRPRVVPRAGKLRDFENRLYEKLARGNPRGGQKTGHTICHGIC